jgi:hypothetical protein
MSYSFDSVYVSYGRCAALPIWAFLGKKTVAALSAELGPRHWNIDVVFRFVCDSLLEGAGFEPSVPPNKNTG